MPVTLADIQTHTFKEISERFDDLVPWYKDELHEPFVKSSYGYRGVVMKSKTDGSIMCNDCGCQYQRLAAHVMQAHDYEDFAQYKERHGLAQKIPLVSERLSTIQRNVAIAHNSIRNIAKYRKSGKGEKKNHKYTMHPTSKKNRHGTCSPPQLRHRLEVVASIIGRTPYHSELEKYDASLCTILRYTYGSVQKGMEALGFKFEKKDTHIHSKESLIGALRKIVVDERRLPSPHKDFGGKGKISVNTFVRFFGSWNNAKVMAGLDQLLLELKQ